MVFSFPAWEYVVTMGSYAATVDVVSLHVTIGNAARMDANARVLVSIAMSAFQSAGPSERRAYVNLPGCL